MNLADKTTPSTTKSIAWEHHREAKMTHPGKKMLPSLMMTTTTIMTMTTTMKKRMIAKMKTASKRSL